MIVKEGKSVFRSAFSFPNKNVAKWFPGHMYKGMQVMLTRLKNVDCLVEVHDARVPFSGRNPNFLGMISVRPHILVLNKMDLADLSRKDDVLAKLKWQGVKQVMFTNCLEQHPQSIKQELIPTMLKLIESQSRFHRQDSSEYNMMVIGVPNVGKSSFINAVRRTHASKGKASHVGAVAGVTRSVLEKIRVSTSPKMYVYDTPGILTPEVKSAKDGMKLALCACLQDHLVGEDTMVDYMLYWLNKHGRFSYVDEFGLDEPVDDVIKFLAHVALKNNKVVRQKSVDPTYGSCTYRPHFIAAAKIVLQKFRKAQLGKVMLDEDYI